jgi:hypothetical protein
MTNVVLRMPRGLWQDLEATVREQDRRWLTEVARSLGLPPGEVIRTCLGTGGVPTPVTAMWAHPQTTDEDVCPWWECHGDELWRRCPRQRLSPSLPCIIHERCTPCPRARLTTDLIIVAMPWLSPVKHDGQLFWVDPATGVARGEDGFMWKEGLFRRIRTQDDEQVWVYRAK